MCGRYALGIRAAFVRHQLQQHGLPVDEAPADEDARETYNFPPGAYGLVYRADVPDSGVRDQENPAPEANAEDGDAALETSEATADENARNASPEPASGHQEEYKYQLKVMKWGLIPFWTKRSPDYGSMLRTINCRDDSLIENRGMWNTMKQRKRCLVIAQGFYEWLKKGPGGKEKIPHFVKRKDGQLMCFAGLWDCVRYEDSEEKLYTYTIITTDSNKQLNFLHDRMPVILEPGSDEVKMWLDPTRNKWSKDLQVLLKPYSGELECYPVSKEVGKVGNNSPDFIVPVDSKENKNNIANFFGNAKKPRIKSEAIETRETKDHESTEDNAPVPVETAPRKRRHEEMEGEEESKIPKMESSPVKMMKTTPNKKTRSATSNEAIAMKSSPKKAPDGSQRITNFFVK